MICNISVIKCACAVYFDTCHVDDSNVAVEQGLIDPE